MAFGQLDVYCSLCGNKLKNHEEWLSGISDYAKFLLIEYLGCYPDLSKEASINEIPDHATEWIRANGNIMFDQRAIRRILAECWNEVEIALDDWRESNGNDYPVKNIEQLHVFCVIQHAEMVWRKVTSDMNEKHLSEETIVEVIERLINW
jgi:hypothetical protein